MTVCCTVQLDDRTGLATEVDFAFEEWVGSGLPNTCGLLVGNILVRMLLDMMTDEGGGHLCLNLYKIFTEEWLTGVVEKGGEEDAAVAPQRGGHVRLPQHHQSLWT